MGGFTSLPLPSKFPKLQGGEQNQQWPTSGQVSYITPAAWGVPNASDQRAMRQRILGSHTPPCHRRMVITT